MDNDILKAAFHAQDAQQAAYAHYWAEPHYKKVLHENFVESLKKAAAAAGFELVKKETEK